VGELGERARASSGGELLTTGPLRSPQSPFPVQRWWGCEGGRLDAGNTGHTCVVGGRCLHGLRVAGRRRYLGWLRIPGRRAEDNAIDVDAKLVRAGDIRTLPFDEQGLVEGKYADAHPC
jgi:hypothetical protein